MADRKVVFYEVENADAKAPFDRISALGSINSLKSGDWIVDANGMATAVIVDQVGSAQQPSHLRFLRLRDDRPFEIDLSTRDPALIQLGTNSHVAEITHVVVWPDGYAAALSSRDAPNVKYLATYFVATSGQKCVVVDLYSSDVVARLDKLLKKNGGGITRADIKVKTSAAVQLESDNRLKGFRSFWKPARSFKAVTAAVSLSVDRKRDEYLDPEVGEEIAHLVTYGGLIDSIVVKGRRADGTPDEINIGKERRSVTVGYDPGSTVASVYASIVAARKALKGGPLSASSKLN